MSNEDEELSGTCKAIAGFFAGVPVLFLLLATFFLITGGYLILILAFLFWLGTLAFCPLAIRYGGKSAYASAKMGLAMSTTVYSLLLLVAADFCCLLPVMSVFQCWWLALKIGRLGADKKKRKLAAERKSVLETVTALEKKGQGRLALASLIELVGTCGADVSSIQENDNVRRATEVSPTLREKRELLASLDKEIAALG